jgi:uncharacterized coiled-coil DUF342 family protein
MDWGALVIGLLIALLGYLANEVFTGLKDDLAEVKKKISVANDRLLRIESKGDQTQVQVEGVRAQVLHVYAATDTVKAQIQEMHQETRGALKHHGDEIAQTRGNFGKVLVILKGLIHEKTDRPKG